LRVGQQPGRQGEKQLVANGSRLGEVGDLEAQSLKLITNFNK